MAAHPRPDVVAGVEVPVADPLGHRAPPRPLGVAAVAPLAEVRHEDERFGVVDATPGEVRTVAARP